MAETVNQKEDGLDSDVQSLAVARSRLSGGQMKMHECALQSPGSIQRRLSQDQGIEASASYQPRRGQASFFAGQRLFVILSDIVAGFS